MVSCAGNVDNDHVCRAKKRIVMSVQEIHADDLRPKIAESGSPTIQTKIAESESRRKIAWYVKKRKTNQLYTHL